MFKRIIALIIIFTLVFEQSGFAQVAPQMGVPAYLSGLISPEKFRPVHLRSISFDAASNEFDLVLEKGDAKVLKDAEVKTSAGKLMEYFQIGLRLPNSMFWVNLRPDAPTQIIDPFLERTDIGKAMLEADLQLKKDLARFTSPDAKEGRQYWNKLYARAEQLFGQQDITIPTVTRPWIVPSEIIIREQNDGAYVYKATMKVMLEQDYLKDAQGYNFDDPRLKEINEYSSQLVRELIIPQLTRDVNSAKRYAPLRQVFYSLVLAQWFKVRYAKKARAGADAGTEGTSGAAGAASLLGTIDSRDLSGLASRTAWSKEAYFTQYKNSFEKGEYDKEETVSSPSGLTVRRYFSGGIIYSMSSALSESAAKASQAMMTIIQPLAGAAEPIIDLPGGFSVRYSADSGVTALRTIANRVVPQSTIVSSPMAQAPAQAAAASFDGGSWMENAAQMFKVWSVAQKIIWGFSPVEDVVQKLKPNEVNSLHEKLRVHDSSVLNISGRVLGILGFLLGLDSLGRKGPLIIVPAICCILAAMYLILQTDPQNARVETALEWLQNYQKATADRSLLVETGKTGLDGGLVEKSRALYEDKVLLPVLKELNGIDLEQWEEIYDSYTEPAAWEDFLKKIGQLGQFKSPDNAETAYHILHRIFNDSFRHYDMMRVKDVRVKVLQAYADLGTEKAVRELLWLAFGTSLKTDDLIYDIFEALARTGNKDILPELERILEAGKDFNPAFKPGTVHWVPGAKTKVSDMRRFRIELEATILSIRNPDQKASILEEKNKKIAELNSRDGGDTDHKAIARTSGLIAIFAVGVPLVIATAVGLFTLGLPAFGNVAFIALAAGVVPVMTYLAYNAIFALRTKEHVDTANIMYESTGIYFWSASFWGLLSLIVATAFTGNELPTLVVLPLVLGGFMGTIFNVYKGFGGLLEDRLRSPEPSMLSNYLMNVFSRGLDSEDVPTIERSIRLLGWLQNPKSINVLVGKLSFDSHIRIRKAAAMAISRFESRDPKRLEISALMKALARDPNIEMRVIYAEILAKKGIKDAYNLIKTEMENYKSSNNKYELGYDESYTRRFEQALKKLTPNNSDEAYQRDGGKSDKALVPTIGGIVTGLIVTSALSLVSFALINPATMLGIIYFMKWVSASSVIGILAGILVHDKIMQNYSAGVSGGQAKDGGQSLMTADEFSKKFRSPEWKNMVRERFVKAERIEKLMARIELSTVSVFVAGIILGFVAMPQFITLIGITLAFMVFSVFFPAQQILNKQQKALLALPPELTRWIAQRAGTFERPISSKQELNHTIRDLPDEKRRTIHDLVNQYFESLQQDVQSYYFRDNFGRHEQSIVSSRFQESFYDFYGKKAALTYTDHSTEMESLTIRLRNNQFRDDLFKAVKSDNYMRAWALPLSSAVFAAVSVTSAVAAVYLISKNRFLAAMLGGISVASALFALLNWKGFHLFSINQSELLLSSMQDDYSLDAKIVSSEFFKAFKEALDSGDWQKSAGDNTQKMMQDEYDFLYGQYASADPSQQQAQSAKKDGGSVQEARNVFLEGIKSAYQEEVIDTGNEAAFKKFIDDQLRMPDYDNMHVWIESAILSKFRENSGRANELTVVVATHLALSVMLVLKDKDKAEPRQVWDAYLTRILKETLKFLDATKLHRKAASTFDRIYKQIKPLDNEAAQNMIPVILGGLDIKGLIADSDEEAATAVAEKPESVIKLNLNMLAAIIESGALKEWLAIYRMKRSAKDIYSKEEIKAARYSEFIILSTLLMYIKNVTKKIYITNNPQDKLGRVIYDTTPKGFIEDLQGFMSIFNLFSFNIIELKALGNSDAVFNIFVQTRLKDLYKLNPEAVSPERFNEILDNAARRKTKAMYGIFSAVGSSDELVMLVKAQAYINGLRRLIPDKKAIDAWAKQSDKVDAFLKNYFLKPNVAHAENFIASERTWLSGILKESKGSLIGIFKAVKNKEEFDLIMKSLEQVKKDTQNSGKDGGNVDNDSVAGYADQTVVELGMDLQDQDYKNRVRAINELKGTHSPLAMYKLMGDLESMAAQINISEFDARVAAKIASAINEIAVHISYKEKMDVLDSFKRVLDMKPPLAVRVNVVHGLYDLHMKDSNKVLEDMKGDPKQSTVVKSLIRNKFDRSLIAESYDGGKTRELDIAATKDGEDATYGGVDFRALPVVVQPAAVPAVVNSPAVNAVSLKELDSRWNSIRARIHSGPMPYDEIKKYLAACRGCKQAAQVRNEAAACIAGILAMEEDAAVTTSPEMKEILSLI